VSQALITPWPLAGLEDVVNGIPTPVAQDERLVRINARALKEAGKNRIPLFVDKSSAPAAFLLH
jgi:hypothetical protein